MSWVDYGFPYPVFRPVYSPAYALSLALIERYRVQAGITGEITVPDYFPSVFSRDHLISYNIDRSAFISEFSPLSSLSVQYINHLALKGSSPVVKLWTYSDLCTATEERDDSGVGILEGEDMRFKYPKYNVIWLKQRWIMLNLLKIAVIPVLAYRGVGHGDAVTTEEAFSDAVSGFFNNGIGFWDNKPTFITSFYENIYGRRSCTINQPYSIEPVPNHYPGIVSCPANLYINPVKGSVSVFDNHNLNVTENGLGIIPIPYIGPKAPYTTTFPVIGNESYGFTASTQYIPTPHYYLGVDVSSLFEFYDNVDEIPTP